MTSRDPTPVSPVAARPSRRLAGPWTARLEGETTPFPVEVPGCWEAAGVPKDFPGPVTYSTRLEAPPEWAGRRLWLRFEGASYHAEVALDDRRVGEHTGMWDAFAFEVTGLVPPGGGAELTVRLEKPASLTDGPDSAPVPGRFPMRETLSGFLPYVWGHAFGGLWQPVTLEATGSLALGDVHVKGEATGRVRVEAQLDGPGTLRVEVLDPDGRPVAHAHTEATGEARLELCLPDPRPWSPREPALYTARVVLESDGAASDAREIRFGLRSVAADGSNVLLNGRPLYPRLALSWGWYPGALHANPGPEIVWADLTHLKALGFNGVKLCLWFPPPYYFDLADELGMLLWVELPMWLPHVTPAFTREVTLEYEALVRQARTHPSVVLYTLGCELSREAGADLLGPLYERVKGLVGDALVRDNSGSGEAYGGLLDEFADFDDHHLYAEPQDFRALLDHFAPRGRTLRPWLFGEYADTDAHRDPRRLADLPGRPPWWASSDPAQNPKGARWQHDLPWLEERLRANGFLERGPELEAISRRQSLLHRKLTLEATRLERATSGYVVTGERDTPISTAGLLDDWGEPRFAPEDFRAFNADTVALLAWERRRAWVAGGDRPAPLDRFCHPSGATVRAHAVLAHHGAEAGRPVARWSAGFGGEPPFAGGTLEGAEIGPGRVEPVGVLEFVAPEVERPRALTLRLEIELGPERAANAWPMWVFPPDPWRDAEGVALVDPAGRLEGLSALAPGLLDRLAGASVAVATAWTPEVAAYVAAGGRAVLAQAGRAPAGPVPAAPMPFWREAVKVLEPHPAWGDFPHEGWADLQFYGMATDHALGAAGLAGSWRPIMRRLDARTAALHEYALELEWGRGSVIVTTLAFEGGRGDQPLGIERNTAAAFLLREFVRYLEGRHP